MKLCRPLIYLATLIGLTASVCGQVAKPNQVSSAEVLKNLKPGVVVDHLTKSFEADKAGLQEGDVLLRWSRGDSKGEIESPFDLSLIEIEQEPRGPVSVEGLRGTEKQSWTLGPDAWGIQARPNFQDSLPGLYREGQQFSTAGRSAEAAGRWRAIAEQSDGFAPTWLLAHAGDTFAERRQWKEADDAYQEAIEKAKGTGPRIMASLLRAWAQTFNNRSDWPNAEKYYQQSIAESENLGGESLMIAMNLDSLGGVAKQRGNLAKAEEYHRQALGTRQKLAAESLAVASSLNNLGNVALDRGNLAKAEEYHHQALEIRQKLAPGSLAVASSFNGLGVVAVNRGDLVKAEEYHRQALEIRQKLAPGSLAVASSFTNIGVVAIYRRDAAKAEEYYRQALDIQQNLAPGSLEVARSLAGLGIIKSIRGDLAKAEEYYQQALDIQQKLTPGGLDVARSHLNLGNVASRRGDLAKAEEYYRQGLEIEQKLSPGSVEVARIFNNLGVIAEKRGDLVKAEEYHHQALEIAQKLALRGPDVAGNLNNLGNVALHRGDLTKAAEYYSQALDILQKLAPGSLGVAEIYNNLGDIAEIRGDLAKAEEYQRQALVIQQKLAPESLGVAEIYNNLGNMAESRGDLAKAEEYQGQALVIQQKLAPESLSIASSFNFIGKVAESRGDLAKAEKYYLQALAIREKLAPGSVYHAETLAALAGVSRRTQKLETAAKLYQQALDALESQTARLGGGQDIRSGFRAIHAAYYRDYIDLLMMQKQPELAFQVLERSRARSLLEMLTVAHVDIHQGVDSELLELKRRLQLQIAASINRRISLLTEKHTEDQVAAVAKEIEDLVSRYQAAEGQIRTSSPVYAALTQPQPLTARQVQQQLLDDDTLLLEYSLGEERSYIFAVTSGSLLAYELPKRAEIESLARQIYRLWTAQSRIVGKDNALERHVRLRQTVKESASVLAGLSRMVLEPVADQLKGKRLLIVSDGALQYIPFAALPDPLPLRSGEEQDRVPLVAGHEIVNLPSASVLATLRQQAVGRKKASKEVAVLADPVFAKDDARVTTRANGQRLNHITTGGLEGKERSNKDKEETAAESASASRLTRSAADLGLLRRGGPYLPRLPFSRREAKAILSVTPAGQGMQALDFQASRATATGPDLAQYRVVHFATHGLLNSEHPELSGLVLSLVDSKGAPQDGFLGLEDVYNLNLSADLVVLSACETGLGKEIQGEGLLGLTRGFMYAGASQVIASLWSVDDAATAELMRHFYKAMEQDGMRPAAALRRAQMEIRKQERWSRPYYWAGFVIQGEWR